MSSRLKWILVGAATLGGLVFGKDFLTQALALLSSVGSTP